ncbi:hypothetical protein DXG01_005411 [Tephrocybe rancida]|nr:hypothetical protein DXG01_005411 [Tephrocybe rancida]
MRCLPDDCLNLKTTTYNHIELKRKPRRTDLARVLEYAPRIREICASDDLAQVPPTLLPIIWADEELWAAVALPNMRRLWLDFGDFAGQALGPRLLMTPRVLSLTIENTDLYTPNDEFPWANLAAVLAPYGSTLENFMFYNRFDYFGVSRYATGPAITALCQGFVNLCDLDTSHFMISRAALSHIATLPNLGTLSFGIANSEATQFLATPARMGSFLASTMYGSPLRT